MMLCYDVIGYFMMLAVLSYVMMLCCYVMLCHNVLSHLSLQVVFKLFQEAGHRRITLKVVEVVVDP